MKDHLSRRTFIATTLFASLAGVPSVTSGQSGFGVDEPLTSDRWPSYRYDDSNSGAATNIDLSESPNESWSRNVDDPRDRSITSWMSTPVRSNRVLFYTTDKVIVARGSGSGRKLWLSNRPRSCNSQIAPAVSNSTVVSADNSITCWDLSSGRSQWEQEFIDSQASGPIKILNGTVYIGFSRGLSGGISAFDLESGSRLWETSFDGPVTTEVAVDGNEIYTVDENGAVYRIVDGNIEWTFNIDVEHIFTPVLSDENVVVPWINLDTDENMTEGIITVINKQSGEVVDIETGLLRHDYAPVITENELIISTESGGVVSRGGRNWNIDTEEISTAPVLVDETLIIGTARGYIEGYSITDGNNQWRHKVLDEEISGIAAGRNALYVTGKQNTVGGLLYDDSVEARTRVEALIETLVTADEFGINTDEAESILEKASGALYNRNYAEAIEAVSSAESVLNEDLTTIESTREKIQETRQTAKKIEKKSNYDPSLILSQLNKSSTRLKKRDPEKAKRIADDAAAEIADIQAGYRNATTELSNLNSTIAKAREASVPLQNTTRRLSESKRAFNKSEFGNAATIASETRSILQARIEHIESYRTHRDKMESTMVSAVDQDVQIGKARQTSQRANELFESENYKQAATEMERAVSQGRSTIETANQAATKIDEAETFDPIAPFVTSVAEGMGSAKSLDRAKDAYERGKYDRALNEANRAREAQLGARFAIDGGVVTAIGGAVIARRYDALSKLSEYIAERTSEDEDEEM